MKPLKDVFKKATLAAVFLLPVFAVTFQPQAAKAQSAEAAKAMVAKLNEMLNKGNLDLVDEIYSSDLVRHEVSNEETIGSDAIRDWVTGGRTAFPDLSFITKEVIPKDDGFVWRWMATGTNTGPFGEFPPTNKKIEVPGVIVFRVDNGKIVEEWDYWNDALVLKLIGYTLTPPEAVSKK